MPVLPFARIISSKQATARRKDLAVLPALDGAHRIRRRRAVCLDDWLAFVAAIATNVNHGGTPGLSRYATWFIPLAIPLFQQVDRVLGRRVAWMALPAVASAALGVWAFHPARAEAADRPTRLASFLWTRHPLFDNPLPEIFAERLRGLDENWLPAATAGCEKILLPGRGGRDSVWPMPCAPATPPARCQQPGATCYANHTRTGYEFVSTRVSTPQVFRLARSATWPASAEPYVAEALDRAGLVEHGRAAARRSGRRHPVVTPRRPRRPVAGGEPVLRPRR